MPRGPLAVRWHELEIGAVRAGAVLPVRVELENAGTAPWGERVRLAYHWLDELGNPIVWDGIRTRFGEVVPPGAGVTLEARVRGPIPPGRYRLALDLVEEGLLWFAEVGNEPLERDVEVGLRIRRRLAARGGDPAALAAQEEPLVPEDAADAVAHLGGRAAPPPDWSRRVLDAHQEGYAVVAGAVETPRGLLRRPPRELEPYEPGPGRVPRFPHPLVCPSVVRGVELEWLDPIAGLPAARPPEEEPWLYDGRLVVRL